MGRNIVNKPIRPWEPMRLQYVGNVGQLMQGGTGSRQEPGNGGFDKGQGGGGQ
ncbi:MAG: hypothetical protein ACXVRK_09995 [Gaiellaceae bacterium]